jgi:hypothetical protein
MPNCEEFVSEVRCLFRCRNVLYRRRPHEATRCYMKVVHRGSLDLQRMKLCYAGAVVGTEVGPSIGAIKPE